MTIKLEGLYTCTFRGNKEILVKYYSGGFLDSFVLLRTGGHAGEPVDGFVQKILNTRPDLFGYNPRFGDDSGEWGMWYVDRMEVNGVTPAPPFSTTIPEDGEWE